MLDFHDLLTTRKPSAGQRMLRGLLRCCSVPYRGAIAARNFAYDKQLAKIYRSPIPVISVGNLSVGGTGKSPCVAWIARWLRTRGVRVAILSRGYGQLDSGQNDEALELELQLPDVPHLQHWDRRASAALAYEELEMQVLLLDDGFQHRRLARDLDVVLIDATDPPSAQHVLPGGLLREPLSALRRADLILLSRSDQVDGHVIQSLEKRICRHNRLAAVVQVRHRPAYLLQYPSERLPVSELQGKRVLAFCGIGNPASFLSSLESLGAQVIASRIWPDHHAYSAADMVDLEAWTEMHADAEISLCTVKDWVKIQTPRLAELPLLALGIELEVSEGLQAFEQSLERVLARLPDACEIAAERSQSSDRAP